MRWTPARFFAIGLGLVVSWSAPPLQAGLTPASTSRSEDSGKPAAGKFLVAKREMRDPNFARTVVLLLNHDDRGGALGLVVNRPSEMKVNSLLPQIDGLRDRTDRVFVGGPVPGPHMYLLVKSPKPPPEATRVLDDVFVSQSETLLKDLADAGDGASPFRVYAGYSGWAAGQLEHEISRGDWHVVPGDGELIFATDSADLWDSLVPPVPTQQVRYGDISPSYATIRGAPWLKSRSVSSPTISARSASPRLRSSTESSP